MDGVETAATTFAAQTTLVPDESVPGRYHVEVSPDWNCPTVPQGGLMSALAARAMQLALTDGAPMPSPNGGDGATHRLGPTSPTDPATAPTGVPPADPRTDLATADSTSRFAGDGATHRSTPTSPTDPGTGLSTGRAGAMPDRPAGTEAAQTLRSLTTVYAAPVPHGPVTIDVAVLRRGRSMSQLSATVRPAGSSDVGHTSLGVFGRDRVGFRFTDLARPDVPSYDECPSFRDPPPADVEMGEPFKFWELLEGRPALGHAPWDDYVPTASDVATWQHFDAPPRRPDGSLDPLMLVCMADTMPGSVSERMGHIDTFWYPPSADLTVHMLAPPQSEWILCHKRARWAGDGYASIEMALWDADPDVGLLAHAAQIMYIVFPDGPPPPPALLPLDHR